MPHPTRPLGRSGIDVSILGLGCMGFSEFYGKPTDEAEAIRVMHKAVDHGVTHFDTAEMYGMGHNEQLVGRAFKGQREGITIATKFGPQRDRETGAFTGVDGSATNVRRSIEGSLSRLRFDSVDLYYLHRVDPATPIEETVGEMAKLVQEGKVRALGLSEASARTLRRAHAVHPIAALQTEYSVFSRDIEDEILPACRDLGVTLVAYSPLGRGILTGRYAGAHDAPKGEGDYRAVAMPRYSEEHFAANLALVETIQTISLRHEATPSQIALAWVLAQGEEIVTIPGTTKLANLESNLGALSVRLNPEDLEELAQLAEKVRGDRYGEAGMRSIDL